MGCIYEENGFCKNRKKKAETLCNRNVGDIYRNLDDHDVFCEFCNMIDFSFKDQAAKEFCSMYVEQKDQNENAVVIKDEISRQLEGTIERLRADIDRLENDIKLLQIKVSSKK